MRFDPWNLGYTVNGAGQLSVHYPHRTVDGSLRYGAGFPFDHRPEVQRNPDSERGRMWTEMTQ